MNCKKYLNGFYHMIGIHLRIMYFFFFLLVISCSLDTFCCYCCCLLSFFPQTYLFLIEGKLVHSIVFAPAIYQHESAIGIHVSPPSLISLPIFGQERRCRHREQTYGHGWRRGRRGWDEWRE